MLLTHINSYKPIKDKSLAHLRTTCARGAFGVVLCPSYVVNNSLKHLLLNHWAKLGRNVPWQVFFKNCPKNLIPSKTLTAMATKLFFKQFFKNLLFWYRWPDSEVFLKRCSLGDPFGEKNCSLNFDTSINMSYLRATCTLRT